MDFSFDPAKNEWLIRERGVSFTNAIQALHNGKCKILFNKAHYPEQKLLLFIHPNNKGHDYVHVCPFEYRKDNQMRFITIFADSKLNKKYKEELLKM